MFARASKSVNIQSVIRRYMASKTYTVNSLEYETTGSPAEVLKLKTKTINDPTSNLGATGVFVKLIATPMNPADFNLVRIDFLLFVSCLGTSAHCDCCIYSRRLKALTVSSPRSLLSVVTKVLLKSSLLDPAPTFVLVTGLCLCSLTLVPGAPISLLIQLISSRSLMTLPPLNPSLPSW